MLCCTSNRYAIQCLLVLVANPTSKHGFAIVKASDAAARPLRPVQLEELLGRGAHGSTWRARLADGAQVAAKRLVNYSEDPADLFERMQRAAEVHHPHLLDVVWTLEENGELLVISRLGTGVSLHTLLRSGRIRSSCAVAVAMGVLSALTALHQAGLWHGAVHARNVHVDLDGTVRLGDHCLTAAPPGQSSAALRAADVRASGALICSMLRMPVEAGPAGSRPSPKVAASPLGQAARTIAGPPRKLPAGYEAAHASLTLWEAARTLATSRRQAQARQDLAAMVATALAPAERAPAPASTKQEPAAGRRGPTTVKKTVAAPSAGRRTPVAPPASPPPRPVPTRRAVPAAQLESERLTAPAPAPQAVAAERREAGRVSRDGSPGQRLVLLLALATAAVLAVLMVVPPRLASSPSGRPTPVPQRAPSALIPPVPNLHEAPTTVPAPVTPVPGTPASAAAPARTPPPLPELPPNSAGGVVSVATDATGCRAGLDCTIRVEVVVQPASIRRPVTWSLSSFDACSGARVQLATSTVVAEPGWTHVVAFSTVTLPPGASQVLFATTDAPARASSPLVRIGADHCS